MKLQEKLKCTTKCIIHQEGIIFRRDAALHDALAQDDAVAAADQRQVRGQPPLRQQAAQQAPQAADPGQAAHRAGQGRTTTNRASNEASRIYHNHREGHPRAFSWLKAPTSTFTFKTLLTIKTLC